ncbi:MAG: hypothetical protein IPK07_08510 [Deltaproteobacteria bacterium]|nr:hypothetical protein [Deltaproteobacteria bacterium]
MNARSRCVSARWLVALGVAAALGCGAVSEDVRQASGPLDRGTSLVPRSVGGGDVFGEAYDLAGEAGRKLFHAEPIGWESLGGPANVTVHSSAHEIAVQARKRGLQLVLAVLPVIGPARDTVALPASYTGAAKFSNPEVRRAFLDEVEWLTREIAPAYLSLATEIQGYFLAHPDDYDDFASLAGEAYDRVKAIRPETRVFVYFQYEAIYRDFFGGPALAAANLRGLLGPFEPKLDLVGLSSYPALLGGATGSAVALPDDYYGRLAGALTHPLFFAELGYPSQPSLIFLPASEDDQARFVARFDELVAGLPVDGSIWAFLHDPDLSSLPPGSVNPPQVAFFESCGLRRADGTQKPAWAAWLAGS